MFLKILYLFFLSFASCLSQNIVLFLTDDQDVVLGGMTPMSKVKQLITNVGITFDNSYTASPICCPSRASILTGKYPHNHGTQNNSIAGGCNSAHWQRLEQTTFPAILQQAGYTTFYAGKYLNQYGMKDVGGPERVPPGWSEWHGLVGNSKYYDYVLSNNGIPTHSTNLYLTDVIGECSCVRLLMAGSREPMDYDRNSALHLALTFLENRTESNPFLMVLAPPAPHQPFTPAPRHQGVYYNVTALRTPAFNKKAIDKHWLMRMKPSPLPESTLPMLDEAYRKRWESLLAVDEMVEQVVESLTKQKMLDNTYLIYTSDNGYHIGQFSQVYDKRQPYESDIRVPLVISGPGIAKDSHNYQPAMNIDLAPTILSLARLPIPNDMDGQILNLFGTMEDDGMRSMLIEYYGEGSSGTVDKACPWKYDGENLAECAAAYLCKCQDARNNTFACLRHFTENVNVKYCSFSDNEKFEELYDVAQDPHELVNIVEQVFPSLKYFYRDLLRELLQCKGAKCNIYQSTTV